MLPIAITTGDHNGIGPEVIAKGIHALRTKIKAHEVVILGDPKLYRPYKKFLPKNWVIISEKQILKTGVLETTKNSITFITADATKVPKDIKEAWSCGRYIELGVLMERMKLCSAITTGPIDKNELKKGGYDFDGHTEMLQSLTNSKTVTMMMAGPKMRVSLVTGHIPLSKVSGALSQERILKCVTNTIEGLRTRFGIKKPRIAVLGLNPHSGDNGLFGNEEIKIISPAIQIAKTTFPDIWIDGPFPSDGFFSQWKNKNIRLFDAVICMYHDQALIPVKLFDFENTVNVTLGLPLIRTSVDHGVGYDIVGKNIADPKSFCAALLMAKQMAARS